MLKSQSRFMNEQKLKNKEQEIDALVEKVKKGDMQAFSRLYDIFITPIYRYVYYKVNQADVEDLTELVFLKIWENIHRYEKGQYSFSAWVFRIAKNLVIDHYRLFKDTVPLDINLPDESDNISPRKKTERQMTKELLKGALNKLQDNHREILLLKFMKEMRNEEIAFLLGKSEGSLRILQFRALKALKKVLSEMGVKE